MLANTNYYDIIFYYIFLLHKINGEITIWKTKHPSARSVYSA